MSNNPSKLKKTKESRQPEKRKTRIWDTKEAIKNDYNSYKYFLNK